MQRFTYQIRDGAGASQTGVLTAGDGDTVVVSNGTYVVTSQISVTKAIAVAPRA